MVVSTDIPQLTEGQRRIGTSFNPSGLETVDHVKLTAALLIDYILKHGKHDRINEIAATAIETGAMYAVKSLTAKPPG